MPRCWIGLGGNVGDVARTIDDATRALSHAFGLSFVAVSRHYRSLPMGSAAGEPFLNAVAGFEASRPALEVLDLLQTVEQNFGRVRTVHWGPRTLDLDLLYYGDEVCRQPRLTLPHEGAWYRRFVLDPLVEVAPLWLAPDWQLSVRQLRDRLACKPHRLAVFGATTALLDQLQTAIDACDASVELCDNDVSAALNGGLVIQFGSVVTPLVPRFRWSLDVSPDALQESLRAAVTAAFTAPEPL